jgi:hypothetical protein
MEIARRQFIHASGQGGGSAIDASASAEYRRRARGLRHRLRHYPLRLQQSLRELSDGVDAGRNRGAIAGEEERVASRFAREVADRLDGPVLRYSNRVALLRRAGELGIGRFEANLVIAAVQHQCRGRLARPPARPNPLLRGIAAAVAVESIIVAAAWWLLCG